MKAEIVMHSLSVTPSDPQTLLSNLRGAVQMFPFDHNLRKMPAILAVKVPLPITTVESTLEGVLRNDPHSLDVRRQLDDVRAHMVKQ